MRDQGLQQAIDAAGGIASLARKLGIAQPSVSNWSRVPADRVVSVEAVTGVARTILRPDLYEGAAPAIDEVDQARMREYLLLGSLLRQAPSSVLIDDIGRLQGNASTLGLLHMSLAEAADETDSDIESREFFRLFIGVGRGELLPYGSYYQTGFLHERPLARVREDMVRLGIERSEGLFEPEDHLGILLEIMAGLIGGEFAGGESEQRVFFKRHIQPWASRLFSDLEACAKTPFYKAVARVGTAFIDIETEGFALPV
jgi:TorA maturation chaperone TorD/DNA-binding transcriptional regulator YdaS (Cro superfamily)